MPPARTGYSATQIALHWIIAVLVIAQVVLHEGMHAAYREARGGPAATAAESLMADLHVAGGIAVFLLALLRVVLRLRRGAPSPPETEHPALRFAAKAVHFGFYAIILLMPLTGALAWFGGVEASAAVHRAGMLAIFVLLLLHVAGALYQHFVLKTDVMRRILRPEKGG
ncbi:MAG: cytochrome b [Rhodospirillaceae bacterium]|nr:cytochrome b [Rhodospirillaceae bacterium]